MSAGFRNQVLLMGNGYGLKTSTTKSGKTAASFSLFIVEGPKDKEVKTFVWVNAYSGLADNIVKYWDEGKKFFVDGRISIYKDKSGGDKFSIVASEITFV